MQEEPIEVANTREMLEQSTGTGPVMVAWENSDGVTMISAISRPQMARILAAPAEISALKHERVVLQKIGARRADGLDAVGLHADCTPEEASTLAAEIAAMRQGAQRYLRLRAQNWNDSELCVVMNPRKALKLGFDCPSHERLDAIVDAILPCASKQAESETQVRLSSKDEQQGVAAALDPDKAQIDIADLAALRNCFDAPDYGSALENAWAEAMGMPECVPAYVLACVAAQKAEISELRRQVRLAHMSGTDDFRRFYDVELLKVIGVTSFNELHAPPSSAPSPANKVEWQ